MEPSEKFKRNIESLKQAVSSFEKSMAKDFAGLDAIGIDLIKNGRVQKFEYCTELAWKTCKVFVEVNLGIVNNSPKIVYRSMFQNHLIEEDLFYSLCKGIDDRNLLSHIYREEMYDLIYAELPNHVAAFKRLLNALKNNLY